MNKTHELNNMNKLKLILAALLITTVFTGITVVASSAENKNTVLIKEGEPENYLGNENLAIFGMPEFDVKKIYTYNTTFDIFVEHGRNGKDAVLYWGNKTEIDGKSYYVFNLTKVGGGETQYIEVDKINQNVLMKGANDYTTTGFISLSFNPSTLSIDYPLMVGKTWEKVPVDLSGTTWMGNPLSIIGKAWGTGKVIGEEKISVPAGIANTMLFENVINSSINMGGMETWMNISQKIWVMENGFFAKRQIYDDGILEEELELKEPIIANLDIEKEHLKNKNMGTFKVSIKLPKKYSLSEVDLGSIKCNGVPSSNVKIEDGEIKAIFKSVDFENHVEDSFLLTVTGEFKDGTLFEGLKKVNVEYDDSNPVRDHKDHRRKEKSSE